MSIRGHSAWLFGPIPDLLLGSGLLYLLIIAGLTLGSSASLGAIPSWSFSYLILVFSGAHYGATLLRVYEHEAERRTYRIFTIYGTLAMLGVLVGSLHLPALGSLLITVYLTWSPWHYSGQNYGISLMLLRRHGVDVSLAAKRWLYASFVLSYASVLLNFHFDGGIGLADPLGYTAVASSGYGFISLGLPGSLRDLLFPVVAGGYVVSIAVAAFLLSRASSLRAVAPTALLVLTQAAWFAIPHLGFYFGLGGRIPAFDLGALQSFQFFFVWAALGHSLQYLWITAYYARADRRWRGFGSYLTKVLVFGNAVWALPVMLFGPEALGRPDYDGGLAMCVAAVVNLHHFILDGAIWKLRNPKIAAVLLRSQAGEPAETPTARGPAWRRRLAWTCAGIFCLLKFLPVAEIGYRFPTAIWRGDLETADTILDWAAVYGRDSAPLRAQLANRFVRGHDRSAAIPQYWRSLRLQPQADGFVQLGILIEQRRDVEGAVAAWQRGLGEFPDDFDLNAHAGKGLLKLHRPRHALPYLERAAEIHPEDEAVNQALARVRARLER